MDGAEWRTWQEILLEIRLTVAIGERQVEGPQTPADLAIPEPFAAKQFLLELKLELESPSGAGPGLFLLLAAATLPTGLLALARRKDGLQVADQTNVCPPEIVQSCAGRIRHILGRPRAHFLQLS